MARYGSPCSAARAVPSHHQVAMIVRRALKAGIITRLGCHTFRATDITVYLLNGGLLEYAQQMAAHESARTTKLYDRRNGQVTLDQVERIVL
jgi:integrase/recombinase XerD